LIVILWIWFTITSLLSVDTPLFMHHSEGTWLRWQLVTKILAMSLVAVVIVDSFARLRMLVLVIAGCFGFFVLKSIPFVITTGGQYRLYGPEASMIADNNAFGLALNMTLPLFLFLAQSESSPWLKRLLWLLFVCTIPAIFFTYSRGALVGLVATMGLMFLQLRRRLALAPVIVMAVAVALLFAPESWQNRMDPTREDAIDGSARSRLNAWQFAWNLAADFPVSGGGFNTYTRELFPLYAPAVTETIHGPHSIYFQVLAEHGYTGLALYAALILSSLAGSWQLAREAGRREDYRVGQYATMFRFSLVGFLTSGAFLGLAYFDYFFTIVVCLAILKNVAHAEWAETGGDLDTEEPGAHGGSWPGREGAVCAG
jgi:probable O-glycosylation ligase (exosortase A-associated)